MSEEKVEPTEAKDLETLLKEEEAKQAEPEAQPEQEEAKEESKEEEKAPELEKEGEPEGLKPRLNQFGTTIEENLPKLEDAYINSSKEAQKLLKEKEALQAQLDVLQKVVVDSPEIKEELKREIYGEQVDSEEMRQVVREETADVINNNPAIQALNKEQQEAKEREEAENRRILASFEKEHPEYAIDSEMQEEMDVIFGNLVNLSVKKTGKFDFKQTLEKAWTIVNATNAEEEALKIVEKASASSASQAPGSSSTTADPGKVLTEAEKSIAAAFNLSEEAYAANKK